MAALAADVQDHEAYPAGTPSGLLADVNSICCSLRYLLMQAYALPVGQCSTRLLACWLDAVAASLRLPTCLAQLAARFESEGSGCDCAVEVYSCLLAALQTELPRQLRQLAEATLQPCASTVALPTREAAEWQQLPAQLWELHTGLCRFIAALTSAAAPLHHLGEPLTSDNWWMMQLILGSLLQLAAAAHRLVQPSPAREMLQFATEAPRQVWGEVHMPEMCTPDRLATAL